MLNRIVAFVLLTALVTANFSRYFVYAGFELNKTYIATKLCENRDKPWLHCNGRCYFMKKIKQAQDTEKNDERQNQKNLFNESFFTSAYRLCFYNQFLQLISTPYLGTEQPAFTGTLFQPPRRA